MSNATENANREDGRSRRLDARTTAGFVVSLVAIAGCVWWASRQEAPRFPSGAGNIALLGVGLLLYLVATKVRGWRWDSILKFLRVSHSRSDAYALIPVGYMGNTVLPARGGELLRVFLMAERSHAMRREILGSILSERLLDAFSLVLIFVVVVLSGAADAPGGDPTVIVAIFALLAGIGGAMAYLRMRKAGYFESFAGTIRPVARASRQLLSPQGGLLFVATTAVWVVEAVIFCLCAQSLDIDVTVIDGLTVTVLASLSALIPAGPGYIGTYDAAALFALHRVDVTGSDALSCILLFRFVVFVPITVVGLVLMIARYGGVRGALRRERAAEGD